jgi:diamine N-acetyltransferase
MGDVSVREVAYETELETCAAVIRDSFAALADTLNITRENCPTHPSFITADDLRRTRSEGAVIFGAYENGRLVGSVTVSDWSDGIWYLEKLATLPSCRHQGFGRKMIDLVFEFVKGKGAKMLRLATVDENELLKNWYLDYGFEVREVRRFDHLPFAVCLMQKAVE